MKKLNAKKIIVGTVISMGLTLPLAATTNGNLLGHPQNVEAATMKVALKHNAFLYNSKGHRVGKRKLYRGHSYTYYSVKSINGKVFYRVGKNRYIKSGNVKTSYILGRKKHAKKHTNRVNTGSIEETNTNTKLTINTAGMGTPKFQVSIDKTNADVFSASHTTANGSWIGTMALDGTYNVYAEDNGMYEIGNGQWIHSDIAEVISNNSQQTNQGNTDETPSSNTYAQSTNPATNSKNKSANNASNSKVVMTESQKEEVIRYFLQLVNEKRKHEGVSPLTLDSHLSQEATKRAVHDGTTLYNTGDEDHHRDENGNRLVPADASAEVCSGIGFNGSTKQTAQIAFNGFIYYDADCNWEHKKILLSPSYTKIGLGVFFVDNQGSNNIGSLVGDLN